MNLTKLLFPYRAHLEAEVEWLKSQLAQANRKLDLAQACLSEALLTKSTPPAPAREVKIPVLQPRGWDEFRAAKRNQPKAEEEQADAASGQ